MSRKNASKEGVKNRLRESLDYCNSHHMPVQPLYEELVDRCIREDSCHYDYIQRRKDMKALYPVLLQRNMEKMIPAITLSQEDVVLEPQPFLRLWLGKWIQKYLAEWKTLPSDHFAEAKRTVTDPALITLVESHALSRHEAEVWAGHHNLYMSAENAGGNLLEEYIAKKIAPYGWIWCRGKILTAVDFCNAACDKMFQVKNKTNTENSSGKGFRESIGARVWCRMRAEKRRGKIETYWPALIAIVREGADRPNSVPDDLVSEDEYLAFLRDVSQKNPDLITPDE